MIITQGQGRFSQLKLYTMYVGLGASLVSIIWDDRYGFIREVILSLTNNKESYVLIVLFPLLLAYGLIYCYTLLDFKEAIMGIRLLYGYIWILPFSILYSIELISLPLRFIPINIIPLAFWMLIVLKTYFFKGQNSIQFPKKGK